MGEFIRFVMRKLVWDFNFGDEKRGIYNEKRKDKKTEVRVTCSFASDDVSTREEYEDQMRKYDDDIYNVIWNHEESW